MSSFRRALTWAKRRPVAVLTGLAVFAAGGTVPILASFLAGPHATISLTVRASVTDGEDQASGTQADISADGRFVVFASSSSAFGNGGATQIYLRDLRDDTTRLVSAPSAGTGAANAASDSPVVSGDGRYVAFGSWASNLVSGGPSHNGRHHILVRDMATGETKYASMSSAGVLASDDSWTPSLSADGRRVSFETSASLVADDNVQQGPWRNDVYVRDLSSGTTAKVSVKPLSLGVGLTQCSSSGCNADYDDFMEVAASRHAISADGHWVTFRGGWGVGPLASEPCTGTYMRRTVFAANVDAGGEAVKLASVDDGCDGVPAISGDGGTIAFRNRANYGWYTVSPSGAGLAQTVPSPTPDQAVSEAVLSHDGAVLAFWSAAANLAGGDSNGRNDVFAVARGGGGARRISTNGNGRTPTSFAGSGGSDTPSISASGEQVAFESVARDLLPAGRDTNETSDVFVRTEAPEYLSLSRVWALLGRFPNSFYVSDPVNTATGNFTDTWVDLAFPQTVFGLDWGRTYNSRGPDTGAVGVGWSGSFSARVTPLTGGDVQLVDDNGRLVSFTSNGAGGWTAPEALWGTLVADGDGTYSLRYHSGAVADFGVDGRLVARTNWDGQSVTVARNADGQVATATSSAGPALAFSYDATTGRLTEVTASDGRRVAYAYTSATSPALTTVTLPDQRTESFTADDAGRVASVRDGEGRLIIANTFDNLGRVLSQTTPDASTVTFSYDQKTRTTTVRTTASADVTRFVHDADGRIARILDTTGESLVRGYDAGGQGNLTSVTDRVGTGMAQDFNADRLVAAQTLAGAGPNGTDRRVEYGYDAAHRVTSMTLKVPGGTDVVATLTYTGESRVPATVSGPALAAAPAPPQTAVESTAGLVTREIDPDGVVSTYDWDTAARRLRSQTTAPGTVDASTTRYAYTPAGWLASVTDPLSRVRTYDYDAAGRQTLRREPDGAEWRTEYDGSGRVTATVDPLGNRSTSRYDATTGKLAEQVDARGKSTRYHYTAAGELGDVVAPDDDADASNDPTTRYTYGPLGRLESVTDPAGVVKRYSYDADGRVTAVADGAGNAWRTTYWPDGRVRTSSHPETPSGAETKSFYDALGRLVKVIDPAGGEVVHVYDPAGNLTRTEGPRPGQVEVRAYTPAGRLNTVTGPAGAVTRYGYDAAGRSVSVTGAEGTPQAATTTTAYDAAGQVVRRTSAAGLLTRFDYDAAGRMLTETAPGGAVSRRTWTARGELATEVDAEGGVVSYAYDAAGNQTQVTDALGRPTAYAYDARGNRLARTDALGGVETWSYDAANRPTAHRDRAGALLSAWSYDPLGRAATVTDATGRTDARAYDRSGRLVRNSWANGTETLVRTQAWDPAGRLTSAAGPDGTTSYAYDQGGNLLSVDAPGTGADVAYSWDLAGRRSSLTHPDGAVVASTYDPLGRLATVAHPTLGTTTYAWGPDGRLLSEDLPGEGNDRIWSYDATTGVVSRYLQHLGGATIDTTLGHDGAGRLTSAATVGGDAQAYGYDTAGQLTSVRTNATPTSSYAYDALGRRTRSSDASGTFEYAYDAAGRLTSRTTPDADYALSVKAQVNGQTVGTLAGHRPGDATFTYDAAGRRTTRSAPEGTTTYTYGPDGRLATTATGPVTTTSAYDAGGRLASVRVDDGTPDTTRVVWDDSGVSQPLELADARGRIELVQGVGVIGVTTNTGPALASTDHLGSVLSTPATASLVAGPAYGPFGEPAGTARRPEPTLGYRGELQIGSLLHLRARDYDASAGGFTSQDPLDGVDGTPTVANPYSYADNDPFNRADPTGMSAIGDGALRMACVAPPVQVAPTPGGGLTPIPGVPSIGGGPLIQLPTFGAQGTGVVTAPNPGQCSPFVKDPPRPPGATIGTGGLLALLTLLRLLAVVFGGEGGAGGGTQTCAAPQTTPDPNCPAGRAAVDADALIRAIDAADPAVDVALRSRSPIASPRAAQQYLARGSRVALDSWLGARGGGVGSVPDPPRVLALENQA